MQQYLDMYMLSHSPFHVQIVNASFSFGYYQNYFYGPTIKSCYTYFVPQDVCIYGIGRRFHIKIWLYELLIFNVLFVLIFIGVSVISVALSLIFISIYSK